MDRKLYKLMQSNRRGENASNAVAGALNAIPVLIGRYRQAQAMEKALAGGGLPPELAQYADPSQVLEALTRRGEHADRLNLSREELRGRMELADRESQARMRILQYQGHMQNARRAASGRAAGGSYATMDPEQLKAQQEAIAKLGLDPNLPPKLMEILARSKFAPPRGSSGDPPVELDEATMRRIHQETGGRVTPNVFRSMTASDRSDLLKGGPSGGGRPGDVATGIRSGIAVGDQLGKDIEEVRNYIEFGAPVWDAANNRFTYDPSQSLRARAAADPQNALLQRELQEKEGLLATLQARRWDTSQRIQQGWGQLDSALGGHPESEPEEEEFDEEAMLDQYAEQFLGE